MCASLCAVLLTLLSLSHALQDCKMAFEDNGVCVCSTHDPLGPITCVEYNKSIKIQPCYCMYYSQHFNMTLVGHCFFSCYRPSTTQVQITTSTKFNNDICDKYGSLHRKGRFCGQCNESYGLAVYSYQYISCVPCQDYGYKNWLKYFAVALLPLTLFYILAVLMSFNVTSSSLNGVVLVVQSMTSPVLLMAAQTGDYRRPQAVEILQKVIITVLSLVNLDFFRWVYPQFCLHPKATVFQVLSLDYIVALYPFLLIFMTYALVTAYDKWYRILDWIWKPFKICLHRYQKTWNIRTSLIEIFATFILLSSVKILAVSIQILSLTPTYNVAGERLDYYLTLYVANEEYFGPQHLPFAVLAIAISFIFVLLPLLLLTIYPCGCFHRCLNRCGLTCRTLHVFMDAFQGSYRTEPRDMRYFSAFYLLLRVLMIIQFSMYSSVTAFYTQGILSLATSAAVALCQPYRVSVHNTRDSVLMLILGTLFLSAYVVYLHSTHNPVAGFTAALLLLIMLLYLVLAPSCKLLRPRIQAVMKKMRNSFGGNRGNHMTESFKWGIRDTDPNYPPLLGYHTLSS